jgi:uncharacterized membrane protein YciS (DUF1049 family)
MLGGFCYSSSHVVQFNAQYVIRALLTLLLARSLRLAWVARSYFFCVRAKLFSRQRREKILGPQKK